MTDFLIVGSGFYGAILAERIANVLKKNVVIIDKRNHIGGNCYSKKDEKTGIEYHAYGTHIFHTSNKGVWNHINRFTDFNNYRHQVLSKHKGKIFQMPINLETINSFYKKNFSPEEAKKFLKKITKKYQKNTYDNFEDKAQSQIGKDLYTAFIKNYTKKQWNKNPKYLPGSIFNRLPLRSSYNEDYYDQTQWQGIPTDGYTQIFKNLLNSKRIKLILNTKYNFDYKIKPKILTIYTGPLDKLMNFKYGKLEWRSLTFKKKYLKIPDYQGTSVVNFPDTNYKYTRIHEPKHLHPERKIFKNNETLIIEEYPSNNFDEPYYPINNEKNRNLHRTYKNSLSNIVNFTFGGRLADYAYYDMDMTISAALKKFEQIKKNLL